MRKIGDEPREMIKLYIDESLRDFLLELKEEMNLSISQIIENASIIEFQKEYGDFILREREN